MPIPRTYARDYRNEPNVDALLEYERVTLSARADHEDVLRLIEAQVTPMAWVQPFLARWKGAVVRDFEWDRIRADAVGENIARNADKTPIELYDDSLGGAYLIDFSRIWYRLATEEIKYLRSRMFYGVLFDYGTDDMSWFSPVRNLPASFWAQWKIGYGLYRNFIRSAGLVGVYQTCRSSFNHDGLYLEGIGSLVAASMVPHLVAGKPASVLLRTDDGALGQYVTAVAHAHNCFVEYVPGSNFSTLSREPERFNLDLGYPKGEVTCTQSMVRRAFGRGFAEYDPARPIGRVVKL